MLLLQQSSPIAIYVTQVGAWVSAATFFGIAVTEGFALVAGSGQLLWLLHVRARALIPLERYLAAGWRSLFRKPMCLFAANDTSELACIVTALVCELFLQHLGPRP